MQIKYLNGDKAGETMEIQPPGVSIGRESDNDVQLLVAGVSRYHAKLVFDGICWKVSDTGSTNGTFVNGKIIQDACRLKQGDILEFGEQKFLFGEAGFGAAVTPVIEPADPFATVRAAARPSEVKANNAFPDIPKKNKEIEKTPVPEPKTEVKKEPDEKKEDPDSLLKTLRASRTLFSGKDGNPKTEEPSENTKRKTLFSGRTGNLLFILVVVTLASVAILFFLTISENNERAMQNTRVIKKVHPPLLLIYEKLSITRDNIFRFSLEIENGTAQFCLDDLKHQRHQYQKIAAVKENSLKRLEGSIRETGFMKLEQEKENSVQTDQVHRRDLLISLDGSFNQIHVQSAAAATSFEKVEQAIDRFAEEYGFRIDSLSVEEILKEARNSFALAERKFSNWTANPANLREAIERYKLTMDYLSQFEPKPPEWEISRKRLAESQEVFVRERKNLDFQIRRYNKLKQYDKAADACRRAMEMMDPGSKGYQKVKELKIRFEKEMRRR